MGSKSAAKKLMQAAGVPLAPGYHGDDQDPGRLQSEAEAIGFPVLIKAASGGGGKGMRLVEARADFDAALAACHREAHGEFRRRACPDRKIHPARAPYRNPDFRRRAWQSCLAVRARLLGAAPASESARGGAGAGHYADARRREMGAAAIAAARRFPMSAPARSNSSSPPTAASYFMEMNTRLQVEHPVTECVTGLDLVEWQLRVAAGEPLPLRQDRHPLERPRDRGADLCRRPGQGFLALDRTTGCICCPPRAGPPCARRRGRRGRRFEISPYYDPMIAKLIVHDEQPRKRPGADAQRVGRFPHRRRRQ